MRKIVFLTIAMFIFSFANAQFEAKINPIGALFGSPDIAVEYMVSDNFGAELTVGVEMGKYGTVTVNGEDSFSPTKSGFGAMGAGKYYFSPDDGCDKFYAGLYLRQKSLTVEDKDNEGYEAFKRSIFAGGLMLGYKWVGNSGILFEIGTGGGRAFSEKNEWVDADNQGTEFPSLGIDFIGKLAIGYRF